MKRVGDLAQGQFLLDVEDDIVRYAGHCLALLYPAVLLRIITVRLDDPVDDLFLPQVFDRRILQQDPEMRRDNMQIDDRDLRGQERHPQRGIDQLSGIAQALVRLARNPCDSILIVVRIHGKTVQYLHSLLIISRGNMPDQFLLQLVSRIDGIAVDDRLLL